MEDTKRCPFCGGMSERTQITRHIDNNAFVVKCTVCGASTKPYRKETQAVDAWNRRSSQ